MDDREAWIRFAAAALTECSIPVAVSIADVMLDELEKRDRERGGPSYALRLAVAEEDKQNLRVELVIALEKVRKQQVKIGKLQDMVEGLQREALDRLREEVAAQ